MCAQNILCKCHRKYMDKEAGLTFSHRIYTSFMPSATGSRSLMPNFLSVTLTSGTTSQPVHDVEDEFSKGSLTKQWVFSHHSSSLTSKVKLLYWLSAGGLLVLVVRDGGVLEHKPVLFVWAQCQSFRPDLTQEEKNSIKRCMRSLRSEQSAV